MTSTLVQLVGWLLVHSVWQFAAIAILLAVVLRVLRRAPAGARYFAALIGWAMMLAAPIVTWCVLPTAVPVVAQIEPIDTAVSSSPAPIPSQFELNVDFPPATEFNQSPSFEQRAAVAVAAPPAPDWTQVVSMAIAPWLNTLVVIWCVGVCVFAARSARGWYVVHSLLRRDVVAAPDEMTALLVSVLKRVGLKHRVRLLQSPHVDVPLVIGWLRPVILLPVCVATGFSPPQLEAVLAHELAHIRRHDYLINLLQTLSETVFFYHPALWWASSVVRREREHCCDELAAQALGNRAEYGRALLALEELRGATPSLALGASGGSLLERIRRMAQMEPTPRWGAGGVIGVAVAAAIIVSAAVWGAGGRADRSGSKVESADDHSDGRVLTLKEWQQHVVTIHGEDVRVTRENGVTHTLHGPNKYFPAIVMESDGQTSYLLTTSWGAKDFWLGQLPSSPVAEFTINGTETPVKVVAYEMSTGIAVMSVDVALPPLPRDAIGGDVRVGDELVEVQLPGAEESGARTVLAVDQVCHDEASDGSLVEVPHMIVLEGMLKSNPGTPMLLDGRLVALGLNNFEFEGRGYAAHAIPMSVALSEFARLRAVGEAAAEESSSNDRIELTIIQAQHVLLLDGEQIVSWADIDAKIAAMLDPSRAYPQLYVTREGARMEDAAQAEVGKLRDKYKFRGYSIGSLLPRTDFHYDRIQTAADLIPDPSLRREATVVDQDGNTIAGAEVVLITPVDESLPYKGYDISIVSGGVRNPFDEVVTRTDPVGRFAVYPPKGTPFSVLALHHKAGIALVDGEQLTEGSKITLLKWGGVVAEFSEEPEQQSASLRTKLDATVTRPEISLTQYWVDLNRPEPTLTFAFTHVPPIWSTAIQRDFRQPDGGSTGVHGATVSVLPGETQSITLGPVSAQQRELLKGIREGFGR